MLSRIWNFQISHNASRSNTGKPLWERVWQFLIKLKIIYLQSIVLPAIYLAEMKIYNNIKHSRRMFIAALFIIVKSGNCPGVHQKKNG